MDVNNIISQLETIYDYNPDARLKDLVLSATVIIKKYGKTNSIQDLLKSLDKIIEILAYNPAKPIFKIVSNVHSELYTKHKS